jgi:hypothetical protein
MHVVRFVVKDLVLVMLFFPFANNNGNISVAFLEIMKYIPGTCGNRVVSFSRYVPIPIYKLNQFRALVL